MEGVTIKPDGKRHSCMTFPFSKTRVKQINQCQDNGGEERGVWIDDTKLTGIHRKRVYFTTRSVVKYKFPVMPL